MEKWQEEYLNKVTNMTNQEVLDEYTYLAGGDDYDGCYSGRGAWKWKIIKNQ